MIKNIQTWLINRLTDRLPVWNRSSRVMRRLIGLKKYKRYYKDDRHFNNYICIEWIKIFGHKFEVNRYLFSAPGESYNCRCIVMPIK